MLAAHPGGGAGEPVAQFPLAVALAAAPAAVGHGDPAADLGEGLVRQLHQVEVVHDQGGLRQDLADRRLEDRAHVDRDVPDRVAPGLVAVGQPGDDRLGGAAFDLPEQALLAGQVDEADVPTVHGGLPDPGGLVGDPSRPASADLVDTERLHRLGLGRQHRPGVTGERRRGRSGPTWRSARSVSPGSATVRSRIGW